MYHVRYVPFARAFRVLPPNGPAQWVPRHALASYLESRAPRVASVVRRLCDQARLAPMVWQTHDPELVAA